MGFSAELNAFARCIPPLVKDLHVDATIFLSNVLINTTPVDTGRAKGNWLVGKTLSSKSNPNKFDKSGEVTKAAAVAATKSFKPFSITYIFNNIPYVIHLDQGTTNYLDGFSPKAPAGMTPVAMNSLQVSFK